MNICLYTESKNIFDDNHRDKFTYRWGVLKKIFEEKEVKLLACTDVESAKKFDVVIENGIKNSENARKYLLIIESPLVKPADWNIEKHHEYQKIFCWDDKLVDNKKYFKLNYAFDIPKHIPKKYEGKKLCCCIAGNKISNHRDELYSHRIEFIRWFEEHHIDEFDLYGTQWNEYRFGRTILGRVMNKIKFLRKSNFLSYRGVVESKNNTMKEYRFAICYENIKDQSGYITEKLFDCFFAGCIPIYWGAKNVTEHIPEGCFIDKRKFKDFQEIYTYIKNMDKITYFNYLENIETFLNSSLVDPFRAETFANTIVDEILKDCGTV